LFGIADPKNELKLRMRDDDVYTLVPYNEAAIIATKANKLILQADESN